MCERCGFGWARTVSPIQALRFPGTRVHRCFRLMLASPRFLLDADVVADEKAGKELAGKAAARLRQKGPAAAAPPAVAGQPTTMLQIWAYGCYAA